MAEIIFMQECYLLLGLDASQGTLKIGGCLILKNNIKFN